MNNKLKPCPFCGNTNISFNDGDGNLDCMLCEKCMAAGPLADGEEAAINAWNMRP